MNGNGFRSWGRALALGLAAFGLLQLPTAFGQATPPEGYAPTEAGAVASRPHLKLAQASPAAGGDSVYRWVDEVGRVHFGDSPPETAANLEEVEIDPNVVDLPVPDIPRSRRTERRRKTASEGRAPPEARRDTRCEDYKIRLKYLRSKMRQGYPASASNRLHEQLRRLKDLIAVHC